MEELRIVLASKQRLGSWLPIIHTYIHSFFFVFFLLLHVG